MKENGTAANITPITLTPEQAAAIVETLKPAVDLLVQMIREFAERVAESIRRLSEFLGTNARNIIDSMLYTANDNPRWWHLYKHAKKARTRKKYRRLLMKQLLSKLAERDEAQEVST